MHIMQNPSPPFNLRLNNHKKDVNNSKAILACNHFKIHSHNFMKHAKFTLIEQLTEISNVSKDTLDADYRGDPFDIIIP